MRNKSPSLLFTFRSAVFVVFERGTDGVRMDIFKCQIPLMQAGTSQNGRGGIGRMVGFCIEHRKREGIRNSSGRAGLYISG